MNKFIKFILLAYVFFTILFPYRITWTLYTSTIVGYIAIVLISLSLIRNYRYLNLDKIYKYINIPMYIYIGYNCIQMFLISSTIEFNLAKICPFVLFILLEYYCEINKETNKFLLKITVFASVLSILSAIISSLLGVYTLELYRIPSIGDPTYFNWILRHKSQLVCYCIILTTLLYYKIQNRIVKIISLFCMWYMILLSNSKTGFLLYTMLLCVIFITCFIRRFSNKYIKITILNSIFVIIMLPILINLDRLFSTIIGFLYRSDFDTLGSRTFIWSSCIYTVTTNLIGFGGNYSSGIIPSGYYDYTNYNNAHNIIIQQFLESGIIGGVTYTVILLCLVIIFFNYDRLLCFIYIILIAFNQIDIGLAEINIYIMLLISYLIISNKNIRTEVKSNGSRKSFYNCSCL